MKVGVGNGRVPGMGGMETASTKSMDTERGRGIGYAQTLDPAACWARIARAHEGRLRLDTGVGSRAVVTSCRPLVLGSSLGLVLRTRRHGSSLSCAVRSCVTLEIDGLDDDGGAWVVRVTGVTRPMAMGEPGTEPPSPGLWPTAAQHRYLYLPADHLSGSVSRIGRSAQDCGGEFVHRGGLVRMQTPSSRAT